MQAEIAHPHLRKRIAKDFRNLEARGWILYPLLSQQLSAMVGSLSTAIQHSMDGFDTASCGSLLATGPHPVVACHLDHTAIRTTSADLSPRSSIYSQLDLNMMQRKALLDEEHCLFKDHTKVIKQDVLEAVSTVRRGGTV
ncbi:unnamed protein product [Sphagnum jensenii]|uniref:Uncharacterized protein n=1 Tax=Sphagnum jensenii TaxID=128206 RepID=A0ABP0VS43_9BRYO